MTYKNYLPQTQKYMGAIETYLKRRFGAVQGEWEMTLNLLADNLDMYFECRKSISENGVFDPKTGRKNGLLPVIRDIQATISKQIMHLGISPYTASKVRSGEEDDSNLLSNLMGLND